MYIGPSPGFALPSYNIGTIMYGVSRHRKGMITWTETNILLNSISNIVTSHHYDRISILVSLEIRTLPIAIQIIQY